MQLKSKKIRALGLTSGGLDSILAGLVLQKQEIEIGWISFETPFFSAQKAKKTAKTLNISLIIKNIINQYLEMLKNPPCGYGREMNPCMDCHALMFFLAGEIMKKRGFDFLFSGEVAGQRPMSQTKSSLRYVEKNSGFDGYILRPLSAAILPETIVEKKRLVTREKLLGISGRSRKEQIKLAKEFGITDYPTPAGGCLLTDKSFSKRLKDLFDHQKTYTENELELLKYGRHMRLDKNTKIVVGRTKQDNDNIEKLKNSKTDIFIKTKNFPGPVVHMPNGGSRKAIKLAASISVGYSKVSDSDIAELTVITPNSSYTLKAKGIFKKDAQRFLI